jgi:hypothetical protein
MRCSAWINERYFEQCPKLLNFLERRFDLDRKIDFETPTDVERAQSSILDMSMELIPSSCLCLNNLSCKISRKYRPKRQGFSDSQEIFWKGNEQA